MTTQQPSDQSNLADSAVFAAEVAKFRKVLSRNRSGIYLRLFDYLVAASDDLRSPKEVEIAIAVFGKGPEFDPSFDSSVRVHTYRLRKKLDSYYDGKSDYRLELSKGAYRILLTKQEQSGGSARFSRWRNWLGGRDKLKTILGGFALAELLLCAGLLLAKPMQPDSSLARTAFWKPVAHAGANTLIVQGDNYAYVESKNEKDISKLIINDAIGSRKDLNSYMIDHPEDYYRYYDLDLHYVPTGTASALWQLHDVIVDLTGEKTPAVLPASRLNDKILESETIFYVGRLQAMGLLSYGLTERSGFRIDIASGKYVDRASGKQFVPGTSSTDESQHYDLGYLAVLPGLTGNRTVILAGTSDNAVTAMAELVNDRRKLSQLAPRTNNSDEFEALYRVTSVGSSRIGTIPLVERPLPLTAIKGPAKEQGPG